MADKTRRTPTEWAQAGKDLLVAALAQIEMHPETWDQSNWRCETGKCLAGWMAELAPEVQWKTSRSDDSSVLDETRQRQFVGDWAEDRLALEAEDAAYLFAGNNTLDDLRAGVKAVLNDVSVVDAIERDREART